MSTNTSNIDSTQTTDGKSLATVQVGEIPPASTAKRTRKKKGPTTKPRIPDKVLAELRINFDLEVYRIYFPEITPEGLEYLREAMAVPSRHPAGTSNYTRYASLKTGLTFGAESDRGELPIPLMGDHMPEILFYVEQPPEKTLVYATSRSTANSKTTPDAVFFPEDGVPQIIEGKMKQKLSRLCITQPARFQQDPDGTFRSAPAEAAFAKMGLRYRIVCEDNYQGHFLRNQDFLTAYYRRNLSKPITDEERTAIFQAIEQQPGITADKLPIADPSRRADLVFNLFVRRDIFADASNFDVRALDRLRLFLCPIQQSAFAIFRGEKRAESDVSSPVARRLPVGSDFKLNRITFTIDSHTATGVCVINNKTGKKEEISYTALHAANVKVVVAEADMAITDLIASLEERRLLAFLKNFHKIKRYLPGGSCYGATPPDRQTRRLLKAYNLGGARTLVPMVRHGNVTPRKSAASEALLSDLIEKEFLSVRRPSAKSLYRQYLDAAKKQALPEDDIFAYETVARRVKKLNKYYTTLRTQGKRAALKYLPPSCNKALIGPPNGSAPWKVAHVDHTIADVFVEDPDHPGEYSRPIISALVDSYSKKILAELVWFGAPNARYVVDLLKECLKRHGVIPIKIRCDWGSEFRSTTVQALTAGIGISISYRPKGEPRAGSPVETKFKNFNMYFLHQAEGNNKVLKTPREATDAVRPENFVCWDLQSFREHIRLYVDTHNQSPTEFGLAPNEICETFAATHGVHHAEWLSPALFDRLEFEPVANGFTRVVSKKGTIRVRSVDYTHQDLTDLVGREVRVYTKRDDPKTIQIDNPRTKQRTVCTASTSVVLYAATAAEAQAIVDARMDGSRDRLKTAEAKWAEFTGKTREREKAMRERRNQSSNTTTVQSPPASATAIIPTPASSIEVVEN